MVSQCSCDRLSKLAPSTEARQRAQKQLHAQSLERPSRASGRCPGGDRRSSPPARSSSDFQLETASIRMHMWHGTHPSQLPRRLPDPPRSDGPSRDLQRVPDPNRQYSLPRTVTSIEARLRESQRRILPKRLPDPPRSDGPSRDLRRVHWQFSRSRTGASIEARLREAQRQTVPKGLPDPPRSDRPSRVLWRVPGPNRQFPVPRTGIRS